jgi:hypothetical protein
MIITESELRELWRDGRQALPAFPPSTRFSPAAQDFLKDHRLEIRFAEPTPLAIPAFQLQTLAPSVSTGVTNYQLPFSLDSLAALTGLVAAESRRFQLPALAAQLDELAAYCQQLSAASPTVPPIPANLLLIANDKLPVTNDHLPSAADHAIVHWLNFLRATARQSAAQAGAAGNAPLAAALGQVSAKAASLGRQVQSGELGWNSPMV